MTHKKNQRKTNGQAGPHSRANGHVPASTERGGVPVQGDQAASVDAGRASVAGAAGSTTAPGADCEAYAEVAPPHKRLLKMLLLDGLLGYAWGL